jgi:two-component system, LytTR family, response regulator
MLEEGGSAKRRPARMRAVISDYDLSRRGMLRRTLENDPSFELVAETESGDECAGVVARELPELAICSTSCAPELANFQASLPVMITIAGGPGHSERVVYDVPTPVREAQLSEALALAASRILQIKVADLSCLIRTYLANGGNDSPLKEIEVTDENGAQRCLNIDDVLWIKAAGNYVQLYSKAGTFELRETISNLAARLKHAGFRRIHRCVVVNEGAVQKRNIHDGRLTSVVLGDGTQLLVGPNYRELQGPEDGGPVAGPRF